MAYAFNGNKSKADITRKYSTVATGTSVESGNVVKVRINDSKFGKAVGFVTLYAYNGSSAYPLTIAGYQMYEDHADIYVYNNRSETASISITYQLALIG